MSKFVDIKTKQNLNDGEMRSKRKLSKKKLKKFLGTLCCIAGIIVWGAVILQQQSMIKSQQQEKEKIEQELQSQKEDIEEKEDLLNNRDRTNYIEELARKRLHYIKEDETIFLPVETAKADK